MVNMFEKVLSNILMLCLCCYCHNNFCPTSTNDNCFYTCWNSSCSSKYIQSFQEKNNTMKLRGCIGSGVTSGSIYKENHIIFKDSSQGNKIYLTLKEDFIYRNSNGSTLNALYTFILLSTTKVKWIVSLPTDSSSQYKFMVSRHSAVQSPSGNSIPSKNVKISLKTAACEWYIPEQIYIFCCEDIFKDEDCDEKITSFINITAVNYFQFLIGQRMHSGETPFRCNSSSVSTELIGYTDGVNRISLFPLKQENVCVYQAFSNHENLGFFVDIENSEPFRKSIRLQLDGISLVSGRANVVVVLKSNFPVTWKPVSEDTSEINFSLTFVVSNSSVVNLSKLTVSGGNETADNVAIVKKDLSLNGDTLLRSIADRLNLATNSFRVLTYGQFVGTPEIVEIVVKKKESFSDPANKFIEWLHFGFRVTAQDGAVLSFSCLYFQELNINPSLVEFGNGSCEIRTRNNNVLVMDLAQCGLQRTSGTEFMFDVRISGHVRSLFSKALSQVEGSSAVVYEDCSRAKKLVSPHATTQSGASSFYAEVCLSTLEKDGISSKLDHCFFRRRNGSVVMTIIQDSCFVDNHTSLLYPSAPSNSIAFSFSVAPLLNRGYSGVFELVCVVSRCFTADGFTPPSSILPQCPPRSGSTCPSQARSQIDPFNETIVAASFDLHHPSEVVDERPSDLVDGSAPNQSLLPTIFLSVFISVIALVVVAICLWKSGRYKRVFACKICFDGRQLTSVLQRSNVTNNHVINGSSVRNRDEVALLKQRDVGSPSNHVTKTSVKRPEELKMLERRLEEELVETSVNSSLLPVTCPDSTSSAFTDSGVNGEFPSGRNHLPFSSPMRETDLCDRSL